VYEMNIEELEKTEQAAWSSLKAVIAEHQPIIDAAQNDWYELHCSLMKEKQLEILRAEIAAEKEGGNHD